MSQSNTNPTRQWTRSYLLLPSKLEDATNKEFRDYVSYQVISQLRCSRVIQIGDRETDYVIDSAMQRLQDLTFLRRVEFVVFYHSASEMSDLFLRAGVRKCDIPTD
jgi:hypothetical protein